MYSLIAQPIWALFSYGSLCTCACIVASCLDLCTRPDSQWYSVWGPKCSCRVPPFPSAHRPFSLADLNDYQTHCTVMNYREDAELKNILYNEFVMWNGLFLVDHSESCSVCGWLDAGVQGRQRWVGRSGLSMGCHMCAVHESHVERVGAMSSLLLMTLIELIESCMLYISIIMCQ